MTITAKHTGRCADCGGRIEVGDSINFYPAAGGVEAESTHVDCPSAPRSPTGPQQRDAADRFESADCTECGGTWSAVRAEGGLPSSSPCCGAAWDRYDDGTEEHDDTPPRLRVVA
jgi:hypothetical protein